MDQTDAMSFFNSLWSGSNKTLVCNHCGEQISSEEALARTFTIKSQMDTEEKLCAEEIPVPTLSEVILIYHRHLGCLFDSTPYVAMSHVWHEQVADLQYRRDTTVLCADDVANIVREVPCRIYRGLTTVFTEDFEVWHDYISVPQWQPSLKSQIIQAIPRIFKQALRTVAYLSDIEARSFDAMRESSSSEGVCRGISDICNSRWFSRVWTAMELTQSRDLRIMLKDFSLIEGHSLNYSPLEELSSSWNEQVASHANAHVAEQMVGMGHNLVPWQLGPIGMIRILNLRGIRTMFASAHELLARRCVTVPRDFFYGLLGMVKTDLTEAQLSLDNREALLQIARNCIKQDDLSPLFMIPESAQREPDELTLKSDGYLDLCTFAMGCEFAFPTFRGARFDSGDPVIMTEYIGEAQCFRRVDWTKGATEVLFELIRHTLEYTGLAIDAFVETLGSRLYGQKHEKILERLSEGDRLCQILTKLDAISEKTSDDMGDITGWIAEAMGLSNRSLGNVETPLSPMEFLVGHGGTLHLGGRAALVVVRCSSCLKNFLLLVGLLESEVNVYGAKAYRVPGLRYQFTLEGGAGFLLQNGRIVGRFIWAIPTCSCPKLEEVKISLTPPPLPRPNNYRYGQQQQINEWHRIQLETRIKC
ncbi:MAG: hypothetical protein Q9165_003746 [Trypethelium subeluteriae]